MFALISGLVAVVGAIEGPLYAFAMKRWKRDTPRINPRAAHRVVLVIAIVLIGISVIQGIITPGKHILLIGLSSACVVLAVGSFFTRPGAGYCSVLVILVLLFVFALASAVDEDSVRDSQQMATHGEVPSGLPSLVVDVQQVMPTWLDTAVVPENYENEDFIDLGSDAETVFLYDCRTGVTDRVPVHDVVLQYAVRNEFPARALECP